MPAACRGDGIHYIHARDPCHETQGNNDLRSSDFTKRPHHSGSRGPFRSVPHRQRPGRGLGGALLGLFTNRHINRAVSQSLDLKAPVESLMNREVITGHPDDRVEDLVYFEQGQLPVWKTGASRA